VLTPTRSAIAPLSLTGYTTDFATFAQSLGTVFERYGFAVIADHGLSPELLADFLASYKKFFALGEAIKQKYHLTGGGGQRGYTPFGIETAKGQHHHDLKEFWHVGRVLPAGHPYHQYMPDNIWPDELPDLQAQSEHMFAAFDAFGAKLLEAIAAYLKLPRDCFAGKVNLGNSILRVLHYPPISGDVPNVRAGAHEDINVITLLLGAEEPGLQLLDRDGQWLPVTPPPGCIVINIGDMLQRLTNNKLPSTSHRVVNPSAERARFARYSMPFFLHFNPDFLIETVPQCISAQHPDHYPDAITADAYLQQRLREINLK
jgi:isopenicillin N synthase-like dioxygenase